MVTINRQGATFARADNNQCELRDEPFWFSFLEPAHSALVRPFFLLAGCRDPPSPIRYLQEIVDHLAPLNTAPDPDAGGGNGSVWVSFANATVNHTDGFALYPLWPSESLDAIDDRTVDLATRRTAWATARRFAKLGQGRPVLVYSAAVRAGVPASPADFPAAFTPDEILAGLQAFVRSEQGPNFMPNLGAGAGTENLGVTQAINDMLLQAPGGRYLALFPVWPRNHSASFTSLLAKGGHLVSAEWDAGTHRVAEPVVITATSVGDCVLLNPWPAAEGGGGAGRLSVRCPDERVVEWDGDRAQWHMGEGERCEVIHSPL